MHKHTALPCLLLAALPPLCAAQERLLEEVSVTASADTRELRRHASTATLVFDREELETLDAASIGELLGKLPGTGMFGDLESKRGKGKGPDRHMPRILVDGQPLPGGERNPATTLRLPVELIERVEIHRNGTAEFPAAGPGGVINLILRDVPPRRQQSGRIALGGNEGDAVLRAEGQIGESQGDFGYLLAGAISSRPTNGQRHSEIQQFAAGARNSWRFETAEQQGRDNNLTLSPRLQWQLGDGQSFTLSPFFSHTEDERRTRIARQAFADPLAGTGLAPSGSGREEDQSRRSSGRLNAEWKRVDPGNGEFSARLTAQGEQEKKQKGERDYDSAGLLTSSNGEDSERKEREFGLQLRGKRLLGESHLVTGGAEWREKHSDESSDQTNNGIPVAPSADSRATIDDRRRVLWAQDEWQLAEGHLLTPGLRWQQQHSRVTDGVGKSVTQDYHSLDPSLHYLWQLDPAWNLRGSLAQSGKPPNAKELSPVVKTASGSNSSSNPDKAGNPALAPERNLSLEIGAEHFLPGRVGTVGLSLFRRRIDDQVQKLTQFEGGRWVERPYNVGDALLTGGLFDFKLRAEALGLPALTLRGNAAYTDTRLLESVPGLGAGEGPRKSANLGADYEVDSLRLTLGGNFTWLSQIDRESSATVRQTQGARRQFDLYAVHRLDRNFRLRFSAQNVTQAGRDSDLQEFDSSGAVSRLEYDREKTRPTFLLALEGKW